MYVPFVPDNPTLIPTLAGSYYTDPGIFARERRAIFEDDWLCVARSGDIAKPGQFQTVQAGGESVIAVRQRDGGLRAFLNVCRHRGARVAAEESGQVSRYLRCPYHAWSYDLNGRLAAAPNLARMPDIDRSSRGLVPVALREWLGYAWISLAAEPPSFEERVMGAVAGRLGTAEAIDAYRLGSLAVGRRIVYDVAANWKLIVENFMECYHCTTIHPELVGVIPDFRSGLGSQSFGTGYGSELGAQSAGFTIDGRAGLPRIPTVSDEDARRYYGMTLRPSALLGLVGDHVIAHRIEPIAAGHSRVVCDWLFEPDTLAGGHDIGPTVELFDRVNRQDFDACERCQLGASSRAFQGGGVLVPVEHHLAGFYDEVREAIAR
jgi:Rieske 2Fe-2S family protein